MTSKSLLPLSLLLVTSIACTTSEKPKLEKNTNSKTSEIQRVKSKKKVKHYRKRRRAMMAATVKQEEKK